MSSGTKSKAPKKKAQAKKALPSGEQPQQQLPGSGGGEEKDLLETIAIDLVKISPIVWSGAAKGNAAQVAKQPDGEFEVLLAGKRLGCVPPDYDELLAPKPSYRAIIVRRSEKPMGIRIEIRL
ncbi:hypothetical protein GO988_22985 [Hymenobacter sp. HMF4947]|uniref:Uncharacterized protein n=1 Tax=Hymenobacter ginkgonis TaxID=2682976 RepID=A0A7K1TLA7_9BACT|nr:hypothetical protein [Hymenobacter ginkgonis]MVN79207.1 hypothetical protein [Hymenobacter ginkgonis]